MYLYSISMVSFKEAIIMNMKLGFWSINKQATLKIIPVTAPHFTLILV